MRLNFLCKVNYLKKLIVLAVWLLCSIASAQTIDAIALVVNGEPVTTSEIRNLQTRGHMDKKQAIELLIQDRLQKVAMKDIMIPEDAVDREISRIAQQNGLSIKTMQQLLQKQGTNWGKYRETIRNALKKREFFQKKVAASIPTPTDTELKRFYENHKTEFKIPKTISVTEYAAPSKEKLEALIKNHKIQGIKSQKMIKQTQGMNPAMLSMLLQTPNGSFTTPMNAGDRWVVYKVHAKNGSVQMPFEGAKGAIAARWRQLQQNQALKDYFKKMKTEATIQYLRK